LATKKSAENEIRHEDELGRSCFVVKRNKNTSNARTHTLQAQFIMARVTTGSGARRAAV